MRNARFSILVWAIYILVVGVSLVLIPAQFTELFGIDPPQEVWIKLLGVVTVVLGAYYFGSVFNNATWMYQYSVLGRSISALGLAYLAIVDGPWQLWIFAAVDVLGLAWTFTALRPRPVPTIDPEQPSTT